MELHLKQNPSQEEAKYVVERLRKQEIEEFNNFMDSPSFYVMDSVSNSNIVFSVMTSTNEPIALCGIADEEDAEVKTGVVWLMTGEQARNYPIDFYKLVKDLVDTYGALYDRLFNYVQCDAQNHQFFIESLGFTIIDTEIFENKYSGTQYYLFEKVTICGLEKQYSLQGEEK